ncbi:hypothetical protein [Streptomyces marincola]|uniref:hypothetical protein n=1 Tax=Streptomyces marincola TaxID=2878388 RepID=UPI001CF1B01B|nr:hypothetical protein [Streptomyces marincola]UCM86968.1 hypothetical protein LC193_02885 [Streptomyces marincola]
MGQRGKRSTGVTTALGAAFIGGTAAVVAAFIGGAFTASGDEDGGPGHEAPPASSPPPEATAEPSGTPTALSGHVPGADVVGTTPDGVAGAVPTGLGAAG